MKTRRYTIAGWIYCILLLIFLMLPVVIMIPSSFGSSDALAFPPSDFSLRWYDEVLGSRQWTSSAWLSAKIGIFAAVLATLAGVLLGIAQLRHGNIGSAVRAFLLLPLVAPHIVLATGLFSLLLQGGQLGSAVFLAIAHACLAIPLVSILFINAAGTIDPLLWTAASSLGAKWPKILGSVILPNMLGSLVIAFLLAFVTSWDEVTLSIFIGPTIVPTLPSRMFSYLQEQISPSLTAIATLLMAATALIGALTLVVPRLFRKTAPLSPES